MKMRFRSLMLLVLVLSLSLFAVAGTVHAQDATPEPGATVVLEPVAGVSALAVWPFIAFGSLLLIGVYQAVHTRDLKAFFDRYEEALKRKDVRDASERAYLQSSVGIQDLIKLGEAGFIFAGNLNLPVVDGAIDATAGFLKDVTDGEPPPTSSLN